MDKKTTMLMILDGFGINEKEEGNAIKAANIPNIERILKQYPNTIIHTSGLDVGLPEGQMGNSEVGHTNIGAGRIIYQELTRITKSIEDGDFFSIKEITEAIENCKKHNSKLHIMGLLSDGGVHSHIRHLYGLLEAAKRKGFEDVFIHCFMDGRDVSPTSGAGFIRELQAEMKKTGIGKIASVCGRYYAMDRDNNYDRTKIYYDLITKGIGLKVNNATNGVLSLYKKELTDEFLYPLIINPEATIKDGDIILWMNYRSDRAKQIMKTLTNSNFAEFPTYNFNDLKAYSFFPIDNEVTTKNILNDLIVTNPLGRYLSTLGLTQARIAETEKYAHVTYFFDGMFDGKIEKCEKVLIPSPKVDTYDLMPEMSAVGVTKKAINAMEKDTDFIFVNFANPDMVGHTGNIDATIKALTTVDVCLKRLYEVAENNFYTMFILADHGNADIMIDEFNNPVTTHTTSKVPFIITDLNVELKKSGDLTNVAPTILEYMDIALPEEMSTTESLIIDKN